MTGSFRVSPRNVRRTVVRAMAVSASGDGRDDRKVVAVLQRRLEPGAEADVFVVPVDIDELAELPLVVVEPFLEARELLVQLVERLRDVAGIDLNNGRAARQLAQRAGHANLDRHVVVIISRAAGRSRRLTSVFELL